MAVKTFTTGEVLTAADTNTYLNNGGLVWIKSQTIGNAVASVQLTNVFSSTYDNYRIVVTGGVGSVAQSIRLALGASATGYYAVLFYGAYATGATTCLTDNNTVRWSFAGESNTNNNQVCIDLQSPGLAKFTLYGGFYAGSVGGWVSGYHGVATAYTDFTLSVAGTMTGGTVDVYGYRKG